MTHPAWVIFSHCPICSFFSSQTKMYLRTIKHILTNWRKTFSMLIEGPRGSPQSKTCRILRKMGEILLCKIRLLSFLKKGQSPALSEHCPNVPRPYLDALCSGISWAFTFAYPSRGAGWKISLVSTCTNNVCPWHQSRPDRSTGSRTGLSASPVSLCTRVSWSGELWERESKKGGVLHKAL